MDACIRINNVAVICGRCNFNSAAVRHAWFNNGHAVKTRGALRRVAPVVFSGTGTAREDGYEEQKSRHPVQDSDWRCYRGSHNSK